MQNPQSDDVAEIVLPLAALDEIAPDIAKKQPDNPASINPNPAIRNGQSLFM